MPVIATWTPNDAILDVAVPLGLAVAAGTAIVVDADPSGPRLGDGATLAQLVARGPTRADLEPPSSGPAFLSNGGIDVGEASEVIAALAARWPALILRCAPGVHKPDGAITFAPLLPEPWGRAYPGRVVFQRSPMSPAIDPGHPVLPRPRRATIAALLAGRRPVRRDRWIKALGAVWGLA